MGMPPDLAARLGRVRVGLRSDLTLTRQILNGEPTEMDLLADIVLQGSISEILPRLV